MRSAKTALIPVLLALLACGDGGANAGQRAPGDQPCGVTLGLGDIAVAPTDAFVLFERDDKLAVGWTDSGAVNTLPVAQASRLAFSTQRNVVYVGSTSPSRRVLAVDVDTRAVLWEVPFDAARTETLRLLSSRDDRFVLLANADTGVVKVVNAGTGRVERSFSSGRRIVDIQILPDDARALVVLDDTWSGDRVSTRVQVVSLADGSLSEVTVPNCSDRVAVSADGKRAFLAPTTCIEPFSSQLKDPISVIDLTPGGERFVRNLPGFGPVAIAPSGTLAVGFLDRQALDASLFDDPSQIPDARTDRYHLMLLDTQTLSYDFVEVGEKLPRFAVTPDGNVLLVDSSWMADVPARLFDVGSRGWRYIAGAPLLLDNFVVTSDSSHAYVIETRFYEGLYDLDTAEGQSLEEPLDFSPRNINLSPSDSTLYLRKSDAAVCVFSVAEKRCVTTLESAN
jgi:DNA-binding beta-propeller fold protein YncE